MAKAKVAAVALAVVLGAVGLLPATASAAGTTPADTTTTGTTTAGTIAAATPVGSWKGTVKHGDGTGNLTISFFAGGLLCQKSSDATGGSGQGAGVWTQTGTNQFSYQSLEQLKDAAGTITGYVHINQRAVQSGETFTSSGISKLYDASGNFVANVSVTVKASRTSTTPAVCF